MGKRKPAKRQPLKTKQPNKPLTKAGKITVIATFAFLAIAIIISSLTSKGAPVASETTTSKPSPTKTSPTKTSPTYLTNIVTFTYTKGDVAPWPWKVAGMTVTCNSMDGDATAVIGGKTYGITGREAINSTIRGYATIEDLMIDPSDAKPSTEAFDSKVTADCTAGMVGLFWG